MPLPMLWAHTQPCRPLLHPKIWPLPGPPQSLQKGVVGSKRCCCEHLDITKFTSADNVLLNLGCFAAAELSSLGLYQGGCRGSTKMTTGLGSLTINTC